MTAQISEFSIFWGIILSAFKRSNTGMHVSIPLSFLNSSKIVLFIAWLVSHVRQAKFLQLTRLKLSEMILTGRKTQIKKKFYSRNRSAEAVNC